MSIVSINKIRKSVGEKRLLQSASIELESGEICALIGPNGAGKTTLIKSLMGLIAPDYGEVLIFNQTYSISTRNILLKQIGLVLQFPREVLKMSVRDIYREHFLYLGLSSNQSIEEMLQQVKLEVTENEKPESFSLGMKQRLLLGIALSHQPRLIILDEPFNGLDVDGVVLMKKILVEYASKGNTVLITSHSLKELQDIASTVVFMKKGKTQEKVNMKEIDKSYNGELLQFYQESKNKEEISE